MGTTKKGSDEHERLRFQTQWTLNQDEEAYQLSAAVLTQLPGVSVWRYSRIQIQYLYSFSMDTCTRKQEKLTITHQHTFKYYHIRDINNEFMMEFFSSCLDDAENNPASSNK